jgi:transcriptional regulator with XRE-family HTH domain
MTKGERIRAKREELGISQTDLANSVGISKQTLYKYENDIVTNIPSDIIEKLANKLNCSPAYIMGWDLKDIENAFCKNVGMRILNLSSDARKEVLNYLSYVESKEKKK